MMSVNLPEAVDPNVHHTMHRSIASPVVPAVSLAVHNLVRLVLRVLHRGDETW